MTKKEQQIINKIKSLIKKKFAKEPTGHDWWHVERVWKMAKYITEKEGVGVDMFVVEAAALLHDIADWKFHQGDETVGPKKAAAILSSLQAPKQTVSHIAQIIKNISFKGAYVPSVMNTIEGKIVQDADRLDALGAIGIARVFAYTGHKNKPIYDPNIKPVIHKSFSKYKKNTTAINHFHEKLLLLKDRMNTKTGKRIAKSKHSFLKLFLKQFYKEWGKFKNMEKDKLSRSESL